MVADQGSHECLRRKANRAWNLRFKVSRPEEFLRKSLRSYLDWLNRSTRLQKAARMGTGAHRRLVEV